MERKVFECKRCGHKWMSKLEHPVLCAKCHSAYWDIPKASASALRAKTYKGSGVTKVEGEPK